jgi:hypothetical protein
LLVTSGFAVTVATALAVLPFNRRKACSKLAEHPSDAESRARLLILISKCSDKNFEIDLLSDGKVGPTGSGEILHHL